MAEQQKEIKVPSMGESVTEATLARWAKQEGDFVAQDEMMAELETDKVTLEISAPTSGILSKILRKAGDVVGVGTLIAYLTPDERGGDAPTLTPGGEKAASSFPPMEKSVGAPPPSPKAPSAERSGETLSPGGRPLSSVGAPSPSPSGRGEETSSLAFPSAQKLMIEKGIAQPLQGTGKGGRITKGDVLNQDALNRDVLSRDALNRDVLSQWPSGQGPFDPSSLNPKGPAPSRRWEERVPMTRLRQKIAERLKDAQNTAAILTTFNEVDMSRVMALRDRLKEAFEKKHGVKMGFMSFFVKSCLVALKEFPAVNAEIQGNEIVYKKYYDIGVAVGTPQGLVVPVVRNADALSFSGIEKEIASLGAKAREGKLTIEDLTGGTFTISNGGVYGSLMSTPILNPPQSAILGMHKIQKRPTAVEESCQIRPMMYLALSYDHRIIDGREAVTFLVRIKECVEDPERLMVEI